MKRGWIFLIAFLILMSIFVSAKTFNQSGCYGVKLCYQNYTCGQYDKICAQDFFPPGTGTCDEDTFSDVGYMKCLDPDCDTCIQGKVVKADDQTEPIIGATITYRQEVWNGTGIETIIITTETDNSGEYQMLTVGAGNEIYITATKPGFSPDIEILYNQRPGVACTNLNFQLANGTCQNDCTRMGSNFCDRSCQGEVDPEGGFCQFNETIVFDSSEGSLNVDSPFDACNEFGIQTNSYVDIGNYTNNKGERICIRVRCCEGAPFEIPCPEPIIGSSSTMSPLDNAIKVTRVASYKGEPIKIRVYYWE